MAIDWQRAVRTAVRLARRHGPTVARQVRTRIEQRTGAGPGSGPGPEGALTGRPVTTSHAPTAERACRIEYSPALDGRADPGEIVWTWVEFEEQDGRGKDRPVLVVGRERTQLLGLMLSSKDRRASDDEWIGIGAGPWDPEGRASWVRLDRVLDVPEAGIRREGAICPRETFELIAARLRSGYGWS